MVRIHTDRPNTSLWRDDPRSMASSPQTVVHRAASLPPPRRWHRKEYGIHIRSLTPRAPYKRKGELLEVAVAMFEAHRPLMGAEDPSLEQREDQMNAGQYLGRGVIELGQHRDDVAIAGVAELGIAAPAVGVSGFAIAEVVVDEGGEGHRPKQWRLHQGEPGRSSCRVSPPRRRRWLYPRRPDPVCRVPDRRHSSRRSRPRRTGAPDWAEPWRCGSW